MVKVHFSCVAASLPCFTDAALKSVHDVESYLMTYCFECHLLAEQLMQPPMRVKQSGAAQGRQLRCH